MKNDDYYDRQENELNEDLRSMTEHPNPRLAQTIQRPDLKFWMLYEAYLMDCLNSSGSIVEAGAKFGQTPRSLFNKIVRTGSQELLDAYANCSRLNKIPSGCWASKAKAIDLKSCPFCGYPPVTEKTSNTNPLSIFYRLSCSNQSCGLDAWNGTKHLWNQRVRDE